MSKMQWFEFDQNNSGGRFEINPQNGIGPRVWIEADDAEHASYLAERKGIYFDGVSKGIDCECCGDRWYVPYNNGKPEPEIDDRYDFNWHDEIYLHHHDGHIETRKKATP